MENLLCNIDQIDLTAGIFDLFVNRYDIAGVLSKRTGLPVHIGNDATLGALAEWRRGAGTAVDALV